MSWPLVKLGDLIVDDRSGASLNKDQFEETGVAVVPKKAISDCVDLLQKTFVFTSDEIFTKNKTAHVNSEYLITTLRNLNPDGSTLGLVCRHNYRKSLMLAQGMYAFKVNNAADDNYLCHVSRTSSFREKIQKIKVGSTQVHIRAREFKEIEIPLPPLKEQKRIAAILDKADAIRRKRQQAIKLADEFLRSVFLDMFGDPVNNPKGWEVKKLGDIAELINGDRSSNYPSGDDLKESGILFLNTKNIADGRIELVDPVFITEEKFNSLSRGKLQVNDLVITLRGTLGSCAIFNAEYETGFINAQLMIIRPKNPAVADFLHAFLTSAQIQELFQSLGRGAAVPQLTGAQMKDLNIYMPGIELMKKFTKIKNKVSFLKINFNFPNKCELFETFACMAFRGDI